MEVTRRQLPLCCVVESVGLRPRAYLKAHFVVCFKNRACWIMEDANSEILSMDTPNDENGRPSPFLPTRRQTRSQTAAAALTPQPLRPSMGSAPEVDLLKKDTPPTDVPRASRETSGRRLSKDPSSIPSGPAGVKASSDVCQTPGSTGLEPSAKPAPSSSQGKVPVEGEAPVTSPARRSWNKRRLSPLGEGIRFHDPFPFRLPHGQDGM